MQRLEDGDHEELVPAGLGHVLQEDDAQRLDQRHALSHCEGDVDAPVGRKKGKVLKDLRCLLQGGPSPRIVGLG